MAWNDNQNPNGRPPELDEIIEQFKKKFAAFTGGIKNSGSSENKQNSNNPNTKSAPNFAFIKIIIGLVVALWLASGFYIVDTGERGVELRFGAFQTTTTAGPHWHLPFPIDSHLIVKVDEVRSEKIGFRNISNNNNRQLVGNVSSESLMLTKDENIIDAKFEVQYKIKEVTDYLFNVADPEATLKQLTQSVIRLVVGRNTMDYVITDGRSDIIDKIEEGSQILLDTYKTGLEITAINMIDAQAPEPVQAAFSDVVKSREDRERLINEAETYANGILPQARGEAARALEEANAYKSQVISKAEGEASRFSQIRAQYEKAPEVTKKRLYLETMEQVLANTSKVVVDNQSNNIMYLPLDKLGANRNVSINTPANTTNNNANSANNAQGGNIRNAFRTREVR